MKITPWVGRVTDVLGITFLFTFIYGNLGAVVLAIMFRAEVLVHISGIITGILASVLGVWCLFWAVVGKDA